MRSHDQGPVGKSTWIAGTSRQSRWSSLCNMSVSVSEKKATKETSRIGDDAETCAHKCWNRCWNRERKQNVTQERRNKVPCRDRKSKSMASTLFSLFHTHTPVHRLTCRLFVDCLPVKCRYRGVTATTVAVNGNDLLTRLVTSAANTRISGKVQEVYLLIEVNREKQKRSPIVVR